jgi:hypothetical protein
MLSAILSRQWVSFDVFKRCYTFLLVCTLVAKRYVLLSILRRGAFWMAFFPGLSLHFSVVIFGVLFGMDQFLGSVACGYHTFQLSCNFSIWPDELFSSLLFKKSDSLLHLNVVFKASRLFVGIFCVMAA